MNTLHIKRNTFGLVALALTLALGPPVALGAFSGWSSIPNGTLSSGPAVFVPGANGKDADVYARGLDNAIWYTFYREFLGGWSDWVSLGGRFTSKPSATSWKQSGTHFATVGKGTDNRIWIDHSVHGKGRTGWHPIPGGKFKTAPAIAYLTPQLHVCAKKSDKIMYCASNNVSSGYDKSNWSAWAAVPGGTLSSEPALVAAGGQLVLVARGLNNSYWLNRKVGSSWTGWKPIPGGTFSSGPAVSARTGSGFVDVFGKGMDNHIWFANVNPSDGSTPGYTQIPDGVFNSPPGSGANFNRTAVGARGLDNAIYINWNE